MGQGTHVCCSVLCHQAFCRFGKSYAKRHSSGLSVLRYSFGLPFLRESRLATSLSNRIKGGRKLTESMRRYGNGFLHIIDRPITDEQDTLLRKRQERLRHDIENITAADRLFGTSPRYLHTGVPKDFEARRAERVTVVDTSERESGNCLHHAPISFLDTKHVHHASQTQGIRQHA